MNIALKYTSWHYLKKSRHILEVIGNFLAFGAYLFSAKELILSLFAPWKKQTESFGRGFDPWQYFQVIAGNLISIAIAFIVRIVFLALFVVFEIIVLAVGLSAFIIWIFLPVLVIIGVIYGIKIGINHV
jgi:hypothetical protein